MKKTLMLFLAAAMLLCFTACGGEQGKQEKEVSSIGEAGRGPATINDFRQGMKPHYQGDGTITFGNPNGGNSSITIESGD